MVKVSDFVGCFGANGSNNLESPTSESQVEETQVVQVPQEAEVQGAQVAEVVQVVPVADDLPADNITPALTVGNLNSVLQDLSPRIIAGEINTATCARLVSCGITFQKLDQVPDLNAALVAHRVTDYNCKMSGRHRLFSFRLSGYRCQIMSLHAEGFESERFQNHQNIYVKELSTCELYAAAGGKSRATFSLTQHYFIVKAIQETEFDTFHKSGNLYLQHMEGNNSCLNQPRGVYKVVVRGKTWYLLVTDKIGFPGNGVILYDLKGLILNRNNEQGGTRLDQNFITDMGTAGFSLTDEQRKTLLQRVTSDTNFLQGVDVMDYSLFVAWDKDNNKIKYGIIDYLRRFTWDKNIEYSLKKVGRGKLPTVIPPTDYGARLREFIEGNFLTASSNQENNAARDVPASTGPDIVTTSSGDVTKSTDPDVVTTPPPH